MATQVIGSLAINNLLPIQARGAGAITFGPAAIPAGFTALTVQIDLQQVASLTAVFTIDVEVSMDGGATWQVVGGGASELDLSKSGYVLNGSVLTRSETDRLGPGAPVRVVGKTFTFLQAHLTTRQVRGTITCSEACTSGVTLMAY